MVDSAIPSSYALPLPCAKMACGAPVKIHVTMLIFLVVEFAASMRYIATFPLYPILVFVLCGPILVATVLVHEWGHAAMSRRLLGRRGVVPRREMILWPLGGYTFCDGLSVASSAGEEEEARRTGSDDLKDDIKIALAGVLTHVPMSLFWFALFAAINGGDVSRFTFRRYLVVLSSSLRGFLSTLFEQACLVNILLFWFNIFVPAYPLDGSRLMTTSMLLVGVALNKAALLTWFVLILTSIALFVWSIVSFVDGVGITGILAVLVAFFVWAECYRLYACIVGGKLREHPLFGRDCYIFRDPRPPVFQLSAAARNVAAGDERGRTREEVGESMTMVPTETDAD